MPMYEFTVVNGFLEEREVVEVFLSLADFDKRVVDGKITLDDGREAVYEWQQHNKMRSVPANYPMVCDFVGVHPSQVKEHMDHLRAMGCGQVNHTKDGQVIFEDKTQRRKVCEALGLYDRNGGYSDPAPKYRTANVRKFR
jgi:hypothetical protein